MGSVESPAHPGDQHEVPGYQPHTSTLESLKSRITLHYDLASDYYHRLWGQHIHHGLFTPEITTKEAAQVNLIDHLLKLASLPENAIVLDVGCGLGGTSRYLAKNCSATVTGITISSKQVEIARRITAEECPTTGPQPSPTKDISPTDTPFQSFQPGQVRYLHLDADLIASTFPPSSFTTVWISECLSHIPNKPLFFRSTATLLRPGTGQLVLADWFKSPTCTPAQLESDIRVIEDGMLLPPLNTMDEYVELARDAGLVLVKGPEDLSEGVSATWDISWELVSNPSLWAFAISQGRDGLAFLQSFRAMRRGYKEGSFRYGVMVFEKPGDGEGA